jgi:chlorobactene glucosyltransferase
MAARRSDLFTVAGTQEMGTFWEKVVQPLVFMVLLSRYGSPARMSRATRARDKIANGQFILVRRETYEAEGGHEAVRAHVAEDLRLAQTWTSRGRAVHMMHARGHLFTRMYRSFGELWRGWRKNTFLGGRELVREYPLLRAVFPVVLPAAAFVPLIPIVVLALAALGVGGPGAAWFGVVASAVNLAFWMAAYRAGGLSPLWGLTYPLATLVFTGICAASAWRGPRVEWKDRRYDTARH